MLQKVKLHNVKKGSRVILARQLPLGFGNKNPIKEDARGTVSSDGFNAGMLKVNFYSHYTGNEDVQFNELSAANYLLTDVL